MKQEIVSFLDVEKLINGYNFLSEISKQKILHLLRIEIDNLSDNLKYKSIRHMYNIFAVLGRFNSEELIINGRLTFRDDNELIFDSIVGFHTEHTEIILFNGCSIAKGDGSSYIIMNISNIEDHNKISSNNKFDFNKIVKDAITPPQMSVIINAGYYPYLIEGVMHLIK